MPVIRAKNIKGETILLGLPDQFEIVPKKLCERPPDLEPRDRREAQLRLAPANWSDDYISKFLSDQERNHEEKLKNSRIQSLIRIPDEGRNFRNCSEQYVQDSVEALTHQLIWGTVLNSLIEKFFKLLRPWV